MEIEFELPVVFKAIPHGRKTKATMVASVPVTVDLTECSSDELDPVATVRFHGELDAPTPFFHRGGSLFVPHCRLHDLPRTFVPYGPKKGFLFDNADRVIRLTVDNAVFQLGRGSAYPPEMVKARMRHEGLAIASMDRLKFTDPYQDGIDAQVDRLRQRCDRFLVCDGTVYLKVSEPVIGVDLVSADGSVTAWVRPVWRTSRGIEADKKAPIPPHAVFRLDDTDGLHAFVEASGVSNASQDIGNLVSVHDPSRLLIDSREASVFSAAARLVRKAQDWIGDHKAIDDIFEIVKGPATDTAYPDCLGDLLSEVIDVHRSGVRVFSNDMDVAGADIVTELWNARTVSLPIHSPR